MKWKLNLNFISKCFLFKLNNILRLYYKKIKLITCHNICLLHKKLKTLQNINDQRLILSAFVFSIPLHLCYHQFFSSVYECEVPVVKM